MANLDQIIGYLGNMESGANYTKLPDGTLIQWGERTGISISAGQTVTINCVFPVEFTSNPAVTISYIGHVPEIFNASTENLSTTKVEVRAKNNYTSALSFTVMWIAIGR